MGGRRNYIIETLGIIGEGSSIEPIFKYIDDPDSTWTVVDALGEIGDKRVVDKLLEIMEGASSDLLIATIRALGKIGDPRAIDKVREYRYDTDRQVRLAAIEAIRNLEVSLGQDETD